MNHLLSPDDPFSFLSPCDRIRGRAGMSHFLVAVPGRSGRARRVRGGAGTNETTRRTRRRSPARGRRRRAKQARARRGGRSTVERRGRNAGWIPILSKRVPRFVAARHDPFPKPPPPGRWSESPSSRVSRSGRTSAAISSSPSSSATSSLLFSRAFAANATVQRAERSDSRGDARHRDRRRVFRSSVRGGGDERSDARARRRSKFERRLREPVQREHPPTQRDAVRNIPAGSRARRASRPTASRRARVPRRARSRSTSPSSTPPTTRASHPRSAYVRRQNSLQRRRVRNAWTNRCVAVNAHQNPDVSGLGGVRVERASVHREGVYPTAVRHLRRHGEGHVRRQRRERPARARARRSGDGTNRRRTRIRARPSPPPRPHFADAVSRLRCDGSYPSEACPSPPPRRRRHGRGRGVSARGSIGDDDAMLPLIGVPGRAGSNLSSCGRRAAVVVRGGGGGARSSSSSSGGGAGKKGTTAASAR